MTQSQERHPGEALLAAIAAALLREDAPTRAITNRVYRMPDEATVPPETTMPFYGLVLGDSTVQEESADSDEEEFRVTVFGFTDLEGPEAVSAEKGLPPYAPGTRAGVLDLVQAAKQVLRWRPLAGWQAPKRLGETATEAVAVQDEVDGKAVITWAFVRRGVKFTYRKATQFNPET